MRSNDSLGVSNLDVQFDLEVSIAVHSQTVTIANVAKRMVRDRKVHCMKTQTAGLLHDRATCCDARVGRFRRSRERRIEDVARRSSLTPKYRDSTGWMDAADRPAVSAPADGFILVDRT